MMQTLNNRSAIEAEIATLSSVEYMVATNAGTYGPTEALRCVGCGDPEFATRKEYETVGGAKRATGPDLADVPGRMIRGPKTAAKLSADRKRLADLQAAIRSAR